ncbi:MAG: hypothetical protein IBJ03_13980 [Gemmatimonadaceae bacterium]|nr:hypothetical protein [Gemmatimonadaceae bacterium]
MSLSLPASTLLNTRTFTLKLALAIVLLPVRALPAQARFDWASLAMKDIEGIHETLRDNHPGAVDPERLHFRDWLTRGRAASLIRAQSARSAAEYTRALRYYVNGFRDGHIGLTFNNPASMAWPGFLTRTTDDGRTTVTVRTGGTDPALGAELLSCDGIPSRTLVERFVTPYRTNADIPHEAAARSVFLFATYADDPQAPRRCVIREGTIQRTVDLQWRPFLATVRNDLLAAASGSLSPELGIRTVGAVTFISLPSFNWWGDGADRFRAFLTTLRERRDVLLTSKNIVLDVRGNQGGNSSWGAQVLAQLWGEPPVRAIASSFDWTVDWRASSGNAAAMRAAAASSRQAGLSGDATYRSGIADSMDAAVRDHRPYVRAAQPPRPLNADSVGRTPFAHTVFLLTDHSCASACLDFMDIAIRLPGTVHVGLPTSGDAVYIDNTGLTLPSGLASLSYSLKVYRNRVRGNNVWYTPQRLWPGGQMSDTAVAAWIATLDQR